jgi:hypothetical protein
MQRLKDEVLDLTIAGEEVTMLLADQRQALAVAQEVAEAGGTILEMGAQTRTLEDVFIEAVAGGGSD